MKSSSNGLREFFLFLTALAIGFAWSTDATCNEKPNVIFVLIDDLGWNDLGISGNDFVETPRIDRLAREGCRFTNAYAAAPVCSATRCAIQSGQNQARIGVTDFIPGHWRPFEKVITPRPPAALPLDVVTVGEAMKKSGYATGYIGKWHLGNGAKFQPKNQGYQFSAVVHGPHLPGRFRVQGHPDLKPKRNQYRTDFEADLAIRFIRNHKSKPFFLFLSPYAVHIPLAAMSKKVEKYRAKAKKMKRDLPHPVYAAMIEHLDEMMGRILDEVEAQGLTKKTLIVFTSDNGGLYRRYDFREKADDTVTSLKPLKGEKGTLFEGGIRVPLIVKLPGNVKSGTICSEPTISYDFYPTFVELAQGKLPVNQTIDGKSLVPLFAKPSSRLDRSAIHWHYPHYHHDRPASCIRERDWKLIEYLDGSGEVKLYNLNRDSGETKNLADANKGRVNDLKRKLHRWRQSVVARMPIPNPSFDAKRANEWWSTRTGKPVNSGGRKRFPPTEKGN